MALHFRLHNKFENLEFLFTCIKAGGMDFSNLSYWRTVYKGISGNPFFKMSNACILTVLHGMLWI